MLTTTRHGVTCTKGAQIGLTSERQPIQSAHRFPNHSHLNLILNPEDHKIRGFADNL